MTLIHCDTAGYEVTPEDCSKRIKQAQDFRDRGEPHKSLEKCVACSLREAPAVTDSTPLCLYCKRPPDAVKDYFVLKHGMHSECKKAHDRGRTFKKKTPRVDVDRVPGEVDLAHQKHYEVLQIQPIDFIRANNMDFLEGNIIKYVARYKHKKGVEDLRKAAVYLDWLIEREVRKQ